MPEIEALIVDDSMSARFALNRCLQPHGMNVAQAKTGEEGVEMALQGHFQIIFMDHVLPGIDGLQALQQIRAQAQHEHTPIIMCTSNDSAEYVEEALQRGATDVLTKPPDSDALSRLLAKYLHSPAAEQAAISPENETAIETADEELPMETSSMSDDTNIQTQMQALDERLDRLEAMLKGFEVTVSQMDNRTKAVARAIADQAGRDLSNRLLRAVLTLKGK